MRTRKAAAKASKKMKGSVRESDKPAAVPEAPHRAPGKRAPVKLKDNKTFPVVGIGASAGGLEALEKFFTHVPPDGGMAFVVISHLDPTRKGIMPELLQRFTKMKVVQARDGIKIQPDSVYVIPPNRDMAVLHGTLQLIEPVSPRGLRMPIDFFFRSLAEDREEKAIGIVLSGMGTDGTLGLKAIKEKFGMTMAQDINSAKYDGMPRSAIGTGFVDFVAPAEELPGKLIRYLKHSLKVPLERPAVEGKTLNALQKIFVLLRAKTGQDFSFYKKNTVHRRIERRMTVHQIDGIAQYVRYLQENPHEIDLLFKELLVGVTKFFRDSGGFEVLKEKALLPMLKGKGKGDTLRVWVAGCSTGEEAYSMAIILRECLEKLKQKGNVRVQIFGTDLDREAIDKARQGIYPANIAADVSPDRLRRFFASDDGSYRVKKEIREMVIFAPQSVIMDPPFTRVDVLCCRNLLIYLTPELQKRLLPLFHYALNPGGILFLGTAETIGSFTDLFSALDSTWKIFGRRESASARAGIIDLPSSLSSHEVTGIQGTERMQKETEISIPDMAERVLIERYTPPAVVINERGDIIYIHGRTGKYLEPPAGKANMNIFAMAREGLRFELAAAIRRALAQGRETITKGVKVRTNGDYQIINMVVKPIREPGGMSGLLMVVFEDAMAPPREELSRSKKPGRASRQDSLIGELHKELDYTREHLRSTVEEMETSQEELRATNEEMQSTNEELQSTNEELTSSKEELQSINEELVTVNAELQARLDELSRSDSDMKNLLNSTEIATIFLDSDLNVRRFTSPATRIINLIQSDVGRPIAHIVSNLQYHSLVSDLQVVLKTLVSQELHVQTRDGRWYLMRIMPYRTLDNMIDGVVVTFTDITLLKQMEESLRKNEALMREAHGFAEGIIATVREPLLVLDAELRVVFANQSFYRVFQVTPQETTGNLLYELGNGQWDIPALRQLIEDILPGSTEFRDFIMEHEFSGIGRKKMLLNARRIVREGQGTQFILLAIEEVIER